MILPSKKVCCLLLPQKPMAMMPCLALSPVMVNLPEGCSPVSGWRWGPISTPWSSLHQLMKLTTFHPVFPLYSYVSPCSLWNSMTYSLHVSNATAIYIVLLQYVYFMLYHSHLGSTFIDHASCAPNSIVLWVKCMNMIWIILWSKLSGITLCNSVIQASYIH